MSDPFTGFIAGAIGHPAAVFAAIVLATFVLEDAATVAAALLAADDAVAPGLALSAVWFGIAAGDIGLYGIGRLGGGTRLGRRLLDPANAARLRARIDGSAVAVLVGARFVPGLRLPTYTAAGMLRLPFGRFVGAVIAATLVWTSLLFGCALTFGRVALDALGPWRWAAAAALVFAVWGAERLITRRIGVRAEGRAGID